MSRSDWVTISPGAEGLDALLSALQALAEHPGHIRTAGAADEFLVPPYLAALHMPAPKRRRAKKEEGEE